MEKLILQSHCNKVDITFREIYDGMDRRSFVRRIANVTKKSESAVYNWISGKYQPDALSQSMIEKELGVPAEILFPKEEVKLCAQ